MMKKTLRIIFVLAVAAGVFAAPGCDNSGDDTLYLIEPYIQMTEDGDTLAMANLHAHIFYDVEGTGWKVESFADAVAGVAKATSDGVTTTINASGTVSQGAGTMLTLGSFGDARQTLVVVYDGENEIYAWRQFKTVESAGTVYMVLYLRPWKERATESATYTETGWTIANKIKTTGEDDDNGEDGEGGGENEDNGEDGEGSGR